MRSGARMPAKSRGLSSPRDGRCSSWCHSSPCSPRRAGAGAGSGLHPRVSPPARHAANDRRTAQRGGLVAGAGHVRLHADRSGRRSSRPPNARKSACSTTTARCTSACVFSITTWSISAGASPRATATRRRSRHALPRHHARSSDWRDVPRQRLERANRCGPVQRHLGRLELERGLAKRRVSR